MTRTRSPPTSRPADVAKKVGAENQTRALQALKNA
jgi:hypothetical protein